MNGAGTQNPHRQLGAHSRCEQLVEELYWVGRLRWGGVCGVRWVWDAGWSWEIPFAAH